MFPVLLNVENLLVVVVGGGAVGRRKAVAVRDAGARVRVVDPAPTVTFAEPGIELVAEPYRAEHLDGAALVVAAATPEVNAAVVADAKARGLWVNSASDPAAGTVVFPASFAVGGLTVAVGTGGASPALARQLRDKLRGELDPALAEWVAVLARVREQVRAAIPEEAERERLLASFADWAWLERIRRDGADVVLAEMMREAASRYNHPHTPHPGFPPR
jgi:precorrin-2 dehydrogenase/sirohydrochlorin ferrochelatase